MAVMQAEDVPGTDEAGRPWAQDLPPNAQNVPSDTPVPVLLSGGSDVRTWVRAMGQSKTDTGEGVAAAVGLDIAALEELMAQEQMDEEAAEAAGHGGAGASAGASAAAAEYAADEAVLSAAAGQAARQRGLVARPRGRQATSEHGIEPNPVLGADGQWRSATGAVLPASNAHLPDADQPTFFMQSLDDADEKPWTASGADASEYFNYGLNPRTFAAYSKKQRVIGEELAMIAARRGLGR